jgi:release factor glutamine methyltransferase
MNTGDLLGQFVSQVHDESGELDAQILLAHVLGHPRTWLLAHLDAPLTAPQVDSATRAFDEYQAGTPLPYILGHWEFFGLDFDITKDVLIPRPETELLVEKAIAWLNQLGHNQQIADIGTGSGIIAVSIAVNVPGAHILATDISHEALKVAKRNAEKFNVKDRISFAECDLLPDVSPTFDLICANPPYIPTEKLQYLPIFGHEPTIALDGGEDGFDIHRRIFKLAAKRLVPQGMILLETESSLGLQTLNLAQKFFDNIDARLHKDLAGHDRLLEIQFL